jgi:DNA-binding NarL/FixJ family response regulator
MPRLDGLEATRRIMAASDPEKGPRVLVLTTFDVDDYVYEALRAGASGFLLKDAPRAELVAGVRVVAAGEALLAPSVTKRPIQEFATRPPKTGPSTVQIDALTPREREVLELIARGLSNLEMAEKLYVGEATVKSHVGHVLMKLGLRDRVQAVIFAYEAGIVTPGA